MKSRDLLRVQRLEDRTVPAGFGNPWPDADHLTLSFAPDGTDVGGTRSNLFGTLGAAMPAGVWQQEVVRAFQTWAQYGNLNVSVVSDNGSAFGSDGPVQGSPVRGDMYYWEPKLDAGNGGIGPTYSTAVFTMILAMPYHYIPLYQR